MALLEEALGARLLQRSTRSMKLTEAGTAFYEQASRGLAGVEDASARVADLQSVVRGTIRITAPVDVGASILEPVIARFVRRHPAVHFDVVLTGRVVDLVEEGFDLALRAGPLRDSSLFARKIGQIERAPRLPATWSAPASPRASTISRSISASSSAPPAAA